MKDLSRQYTDPAGSCHLIAVTGGIGSGKSVVSRALRAMGYEVYDCDSEARRLMDSSYVIKGEIAARIGPECVKNGCIDRQELSRIVFADSEMLSVLNGIVHGAVRADLDQWHGSRAGLRFVETAILYQSGLDAMVDAVIEVTAPRSLRLERVMKRSNLTAAQAQARIDAQDGYVPPCPHPDVRILINDGVHPVLPQLEEMLAKLGSGAEMKKE
ncbi:MAG: dephospho-CoA kinase [Duncaniella sp.]|nr:dephospho-CoA kinase [Duncaniella sp.]